MKPGSILYLSLVLISHILIGELLELHLGPGVSLGHEDLGVISHQSPEVCSSISHASAGDWGSEILCRALTFGVFLSKFGVCPHAILLCLTLLYDLNIEQVNEALFSDRGRGIFSNHYNILDPTCLINGKSGASKIWWERCMTQI